MHRHIKTTAIALALGLGLGLSGAASAADLGTRPAPVYTKAPMMAPAFSWTGCYVGGNAGGAWSKTAINIPAYPSPNSETDTSSAIGGGQVGCNYQVSQFVFGIEGDYDWTKLSGSSLSGNGGTELFHVDFNSLATARGRLGWAWDRTLLYATGGAAWTHINSNYVPVAGGFNTATYQGWVAGGGIEYAFAQNWIVGAEYLHAAFDTKNFIFLGPTNVQEKSIDVVRARLSYKFF